MKQSAAPRKPYEQFVRYYDAIVGKRPDLSTYALKLIRRYAPKARSLLELGCGSGSLLEEFERHFETTGVDLSPAMLRQARRRCRRSTLVAGDITAIRLEKRFDAIVCLFDTMNHLTSFDDWRRVMQGAADHLNPDGVFIFDVNTTYKLFRYSTEPPNTEHVGRDTGMVEARRLSASRFEVILTYFEHQRGDAYRRHEMRIPELTASSEKIRRAVKRSFSHVRVFDADRAAPNDSSEELFFVCRHPRR